MSITFSGLPDEKGSPFLALHERCANEWSAFAVGDGTVSGHFNSWHFEAQISLSTPGASWSIYGHKRQHTVGGAIPMNSPNHEVTRFSGHIDVPPQVEFSVRPKGVLAQILMLMGGPIHPSGISKELVVRTNDLAAYRKALAGHEQTLRDLHIEMFEVSGSRQIKMLSNVLMTTREELSGTLNILKSFVASR